MITNKELLQRLLLLFIALFYVGLPTVHALSNVYYFNGFEDNNITNANFSIISSLSITSSAAANGTYSLKIPASMNTIAYLSNWSSSLSALNISMWIRTNGTNDNGQGAACGEWSSTPGNCYGAGGGSGVEPHNTYYQNTHYGTNTGVAIGSTWHLLRYSYDGTTFVPYIDGVQANASDVTTKILRLAFKNTGSNIEIYIDSICVHTGDDANCKQTVTQNKILNWSNQQASSNLNGTLTNFSVDVTSAGGVNLRNCTGSIDNGTGIFTNQSVQLLNSTSSTCSFLAFTNRTAGSMIRWYFTIQGTDGTITYTNTTTISNYTTVAPIPTGAVDLSQGLVSYYDRGLVTDRLNRNNLTSPGTLSTTTTNCKGTTCWLFSGINNANNYLIMHNFTGIGATSDFTIRAWVYSNLSGNPRMIMSTQGTSQNNERFELRIYDTNYPWEANANVAGDHAAATAYSAPSNAQTYIAMTYKQSTGNLSLYINGSYIASATVTKTQGWQDFAVSAFGNGAGFPWNGTIDEMGVWNVTLNSTAIGIDYNNSCLYASLSYCGGNAPPVPDSLTYNGITQNTTAINASTLINISIAGGGNVTLSNCTISLDNGGGVFRNVSTQQLIGQSGSCGYVYTSNGTNGSTIRYYWTIEGINASNYAYKNTTSITSYVVNQVTLAAPILWYNFTSQSTNDISGYNRTLTRYGLPYNWSPYGLTLSEDKTYVQFSAVGLGVGTDMPIAFMLRFRMPDGPPVPTYQSTWLHYDVIPKIGIGGLYNGQGNGNNGIEMQFQGGAGCQPNPFLNDTPLRGYGDGKEHTVVVSRGSDGTQNTTNGTVYAYFDGYLLGTRICDGAVDNTGTVSIGYGVGNPTSYTPVTMMEVKIYNRSVTAAEALSFNNSGPANLTYTTLTIRMNNSVDGSYITSFCAQASNATSNLSACTTEGNISLPNIVGTIVVNVYNVSNGTYFNKSITLTNVNTSYQVTVQDYQGIINVSAFQLYTNKLLTQLTATNNIVVNNSGGKDYVLVPANIGQNNIFVDVTGNYSKNISCMLASPLQLTTCNATGIYDEVYTFVANAAGITVNNFTIAITNTTLGIVPSSKTTTNGSMSFNILQGYYYLLNLTSFGYAYASATLQANNATQLYNFTLYQSNYVNITFYDEQTNNDITQAVITCDIIGTTSGGQSYNTSNGTIITTVLIPDEYTLRYYGLNFSGGVNYTIRFWHITLLNNTAPVLRLPMLKASAATQVTGSVVTSTNSPLNGKTVKAYKYDPYTGFYVLNQVAMTDNKGSFVINVEFSNEFYYFTVEDDTGVMFKSSPSYIYGTTLSPFVVETLTGGFTYTFDENNIASSMTFDNITGTLTWTYTDQDNIASKACLYTYQYVYTGRQQYDMQCANTPAGSVQTTIPLNGTWQFYGIVTKNGIDHVIGQYYQDFKQPMNNEGTSKMGLFILLLVEIVLFFALKEHPPIMVAVCGIVPLLFSIVGFIAIGVPYTLPLAVLMAFIALLLGRNQPSMG